MVIVVLLVGIALIDGAFAGYRAATGRNGRVHKQAFYRTARRRGLAASAVVLSGLSVLLLLALATAPERYPVLLRAGQAMLWVIGPYAAVVVATMIGYAVLPRRSATYLVLLGLGPMTLIRPAVAVGAGLAAVASVPDPVVVGGAVLAVAGVLAVEPWVHRRWYAQPM